MAFSSTTFAIADAVILLTGIALVSFEYQSVISTMKQFPAFVRVSGPKMSIATNSYGFNGGNNLNSYWCLSEGQYLLYDLHCKT